MEIHSTSMLFFILRTYSKHFISFMMILPQFTPEKCRFSSFQRGRAFRDAPVVVDVHGPWATGAVPVFLRPKGRQVLGGQADSPGGPGKSLRTWEFYGILPSNIGDFHGFSWIFMDFDGCSWILMVFDGFWAYASEHTNF
jgi:hypothetical protein